MKFITKIKKVKAPNLYISIIWILCIGTVTLFLSSLNNLYLLNLDKETSKSIISTCLAISGAFIGFYVIYLTISFENFKRNYGQYALELFKKDRVIWSLGYLFVVVIIIGLVAFLYSDTGTFFYNFLFNLTCFHFFIGVFLLLPFGQVIINKSASNSYLKVLITELKENDFKYKETINSELRPVLEIINRSDENKFDIISNILAYNISANNNKNSIEIILNLFERIQTLLNKADVQKGKVRTIIFSFLEMLQSSFDLYISKKDFAGVQIVLASLNSCNKIISIKKYDGQFIKKAFETIEYITQSLIELELEKLVNDSLWVYYHMTESQLTFNMPNEGKTWKEDEYFGLIPRSGKEAEDNHRKFELIDEFVAFKFNAVIERCFLIKNHYIVEDCVRMLGIFTEMIVFNTNMGNIQKRRIGSSLALSSVEAIKRFVTARYPSKLNYLNYFMGTTVILNGLEQNIDFSEAIFETLIDLFEFLSEKNLVQISDVQEISGLCRLIIAHSIKIKHSKKYIEKILIVQKELKTKYVKYLIINSSKDNSQTIKKIISEIQKDLKSYLPTMVAKNIIDDNLKALILQYSNN